jgi:hypothetical protein
VFNLNSKKLLYYFNNILYMGNKQKSKEVKGGEVKGEV